MTETDPASRERSNSAFIERGATARSRRATHAKKAASQPARGWALCAVGALLVAVACGGSDGGGDPAGGGDSGRSGASGARSGQSNSGTTAGGSAGEGADAGAGLSGGGESGGGESGATGTGGTGEAGDIGRGDAGTGEGGDSIGGSSGASAGTGGGTVQCAPFTGACMRGGDCCSGVCDSASRTCAKNPLQCSAAGSACRENTECCTGNCANNVCRATACVADGAACQNANACCSGACGTDGLCRDINGGASTCRSSGNPCTAGAQCCSGLCNDKKQCDAGSSFCTQLFDACSEGSDCCSGLCIKAASATHGYCGTQTVGPNRCANGQAGMICNDCGTCCSRACAPGPSGVFICQPPSGCRPAGEICKNTEECCGGNPDSGLPGAQESAVTCEKAAGALYGRCKTQQCTPQGDVCQLAGGTCGSSTALPSNCCPTNNQPANPEWKRGECEFDELLIPRCNGLKSCRPSGAYCSSSADCCRDPNDPTSVALPCVPDPTDGDRLKCKDPGGTAPCIRAGDSCTAHADCCRGALCVVQPGDIFGTCGNTTTGTGGAGGRSSGGAAGATAGAGRSGAGGSGGTTGGRSGASGTAGIANAAGRGGDAPGCAAYGQGCGSPQDCCNTSLGVTCYSNKCLVPPG